MMLSRQAASERGEAIIPRPISRRLWRIVLIATAWSLDACEGGADDTVRFNRDIRPILADNCLACHGFESSKRQAGLRLDQQSGATAKLESGARAIVPGNVVDSELWKRVTSSDEELRMPPVKSGKRLTEAQRDTLKQWIEQGAKYEPHWAFIPVIRPQPPRLPDTHLAIDQFVRARLITEGIAPAPPADRSTLIRRVTLDLTGLPPTPLEADAFVNDSRSDAYERVVDRLLGSEHFGERWARWWLDLAHYGDSDGYLQDFIRPVAWRYRQWVVDAFNRDLPFDQFTIQQLAGDLLPDATGSQKIGTGFLRNTLSNREGGADLEEFRVKQCIDRTTTVATTWLALTMGCAECHDHKFDPLSQREFYQLYAFFNDADEANYWVPLTGEREPWERAKPEHDRKRAELLAPVADSLAELQADWEQRILRAESHPNEDFTWDRELELLGLQWGQNLGEGQLEGLNILKIPPVQRTQDQRDRLLDYFLKRASSHYGTKCQELKLNELTAKLDALAGSLPSVTRAPGMMKAVAQRTTQIHIRGEFRRKGDTVEPGTPAVLPILPNRDTADRLTLARWLVSREQPLTARVTVNRLWQELFGRGLVATSENFGVRGELPSHPELLDWFAVEFMDQGWSMKSILRQMVLSQTYRQSSVARPELATRDPKNRLLARQVRLRLSAESVRDATLAVSGLLSPTVGGPSVKPPQPASVTKEGYSNSWKPSEGADRYRRGLYTWLQRTTPYAQFMTFDMPDMSRVCARRERSNTPLQSLQLLNDPVFFEASQALAARVLREAPGVDQRRLTHLFALSLSRAPTEAESARLLEYLRRQRQLLSETDSSTNETSSKEISRDETAWGLVCSVVLNLDEFINRE